MLKITAKFFLLLYLISYCFSSVAYGLDYFDKCKAAGEKLLLEVDDNGCVDETKYNEFVKQVAVAYCSFDSIDKYETTYSSATNYLKYCTTAGQNCLNSIVVLTKLVFAVSEDSTTCPNGIEFPLIGGIEFSTEGFSSQVLNFCNNLKTYRGQQTDTNTNLNNFLQYCPYCGNSRKEGSEFCDAGSSNGEPGFCSATCSYLFQLQAPQIPSINPFFQTCGNGIREGTEQCDKGKSNGIAGAHCTKDCRLSAF